MKFPEWRLCSSGSSRLSPSGSWGGPRGEHLSIRVRSYHATSFTDPSASRNTFSVSTNTDGNARVRGRSTLSSLTLTWLYIEPFPCGGVRPAGDPVDSDPGAVFEEDPHPRSDAGRPLEPWVCRHTREPTVLSRVSCRPPHLHSRPFSPALPVTWAHFQGKWRLSSPYHVAATYPCGQPGSSSFASHWKFLPRRLDGATEGC